MSAAPTRIRQMIAEIHPRGFGIRVGWRVFDYNGDPFEVWWGNTRDPSTLVLLIEDAKKHDYVFELDQSVLDIIPAQRKDATP